jgi:hypothetical protein
MAPLLVGLISYGPSLIRMAGELFGGKTSVAAYTVGDLVDGVKGLPAAVAEEKLAEKMAKLPPETLLAFEQAKVRLQEIEKEREANRLVADTAQQAAALADMQSARQRDVELRKSGDNNTRADVMVIGAVVGLISCLAVLIFFKGEVPGEVVGIVSMVAGIFGACLKDAYAFEFGSSRGSKEKDALLGEIVKMP